MVTLGIGSLGHCLAPQLMAWVLVLPSLMDYVNLGKFLLSLASLIAYLRSPWITEVVFKISGTKRFIMLHLFQNSKYVR